MSSKANKTGRMLENTIARLFTNLGFIEMSYKQWRELPEAWKGDALVRHVPYTTIYGHKGRTEFLVSSPQRRLHTRIECKWQQSSGSVDEKLPYLYLNTLFAMPEEHILLILSGKGWKDGALNWIHQAVEQRLFFPQNSKKKIQVLNLDSFLTWANDNL